ncbi:MAG: NB-ARC domain-containing protein [Brasilonema sp.]
MSDTLQASKQGLEIIDHKRRQKGWTRTAQIWCDNADSVSISTLRRFLQGEAIRRNNFIALCKAVGADWQQVAENTTDDGINKKNQNWKGAPDVQAFYGRTQELQSLTQWIVGDRCRVVPVLGPTGIGKTALCVKLANRIEGQFEYLVWRSLRNAPSLQDILVDLINFLSAEQNTDLPNVNDLISKLLDVLHQHRVLLVLDAWENVLRSNHRAGVYKTGYETYGELLRRIGEESHQSCLLITSQEKPEELVTLGANNSQTVRSLKLEGLNAAAATEIFKVEQLTFTDNDAEWLIRQYRGNPLALIHICQMIKELFEGNVTEYVRKNTIVVPPQLKRVIQERFTDLSKLERKTEKQILCCLARESEPIDLDRLYSQIPSEISESEFIESLLSLEWRSLIERISQNGMAMFTLQPVVRKCANRFLC